MLGYFRGPPAFHDNGEEVLVSLALHTCAWTSAGRGEARENHSTTVSEGYFYPLVC